MATKSQELNRVGECLYRNGNGTYFALVKARGKQFKRSLKTVDLPIAKRRLADFRKKVDRLRSGDRNIRFEEFADHWLATIKAEQKPKSWDRRRVALNGLLPFFKGTPLKSLDYQQIDDWRVFRGTQLSPRSYNIELETLKILLRHAVERGILLENYADNLRRRKQIKKKPVIPTRQEFSALVAGLRMAPKAVASGAADMVEFLAYSGMRIGEAREVKWGHINFHINNVLITGGELGTKNQRERTIPLFPALRNLIERMLEVHKSPFSPKERLFNLYSPRGAIRNACLRMGLPQYSVHSLRHFFASNATESNVGLKSISHWLGHSDGGKLVAETYSHLREDFDTEMAKRMDFTAAV